MFQPGEMKGGETIGHAADSNYFRRMSVDESQLIERCRTGDDAAFGELVDHYKNLVYGLIYRMVADKSVVDDLAQDVFLKMYRGIPYFRGDARLSTWLFRIVHNTCAQRHNNRPPAVSLDSSDHPSLPPRQMGSTDGAFAELETRDRLEKALARLPSHYRMLVAAHYLQGVQYEALAEALNMPLGTVKTHLYRAKRQLRELLEESFR